jgi:hypothetical protein
VEVTRAVGTVEHVDLGRLVMIQLIENLPADVVGIEASGRVHADEYKSVLDPAVEAVLKSHDKVRMLYVLGNDFDGYTGGAIWEDTKLGLSDWSQWEKIALVTDHKAYADGARAFAWLMPGKLKVFAMAELAAARAWVVE